LVCTPDPEHTTQRAITQRALVISGSDDVVERVERLLYRPLVIEQMEWVGINVVGAESP
jgi:hypothetical protein